MGEVAAIVAEVVENEEVPVEDEGIFDILLKVFFKISKAKQIEQEVTW